MVFSHCPVTSSQRNRSPAGIQVSRGGAVEAALSSHWAQSFPVEACGRAIETYACKGHSANNDGDCYWTTPIDAVRERGAGDRIGCGDVVVAHDGSIDAGILI